MPIAFFSLSYFQVVRRQMRHNLKKKKKVLRRKNGREIKKKAFYMEHTYGKRTQ